MTTQRSESAILRIAGISGILQAIGALIVLLVLAYLSQSAADHRMSIALFFSGTVASTVLYIVYMHGLSVVGSRIKENRIVFICRSMMVLSVFSTVLIVSHMSLLTSPFFIETLSICGSLLTALLGWMILCRRDRFGNIALWYGIAALLSPIGILPIVMYMYIDILLNTLTFIFGSVLLYRESTRV